MTNASEIIEKLTPIFRDLFEDDSLVPTPNMTAKDVVGWDSIAHIMLITEVEKRFSIRFTTAEVSSFENVGQFVTSILAKSKT